MDCCALHGIYISLHSFSYLFTFSITKMQKLIQGYLANGKLVLYEIFTGEVLHQREQTQNISAQSSAWFLRKWTSSPITILHFS